MPIETPLFELILRYVQVAILAVIYPLGVLILLYLARRDFQRWVNFQIRMHGQDDELREETKEFLE